MMRIDIYSDIVCPWCFVGKRRLERALGQFKDIGQAQIIWRPFQLNPTMPDEGMDRNAYLKAKFGSLENFGRMKGQLLAAGEDEKIPFAFEKIKRSPNTFAAHRLVWYAEQQGRQDATVESLFQGYFTEGADIGSMPVLTQLAGRAGLDVAIIESFLRGEEGTTEVKAEEAVGRRLGINGVPYFILNGSIAIYGAQPPDSFMSAIRQAEKQP